VPKRILFLNPVGSIGGAEQVLLYALRAVRGEFPEVECRLLITDDGPLVAEAEKLGVPTTILPLPPELAALGESGIRGPRWRRVSKLAFRSLRYLPRAIGYAREFRKIIRCLNPDLIHSNGIKTHLLARLSGARAPVVWHVHDFLGQRPLIPRVLRRATRGLAGAIGVSQAVVDDMQWLLPRIPVRLVYNAVDTERFYPAPANGTELDDLAGLPRADRSMIRIGLVATFARWKGQEVFLQAAARLVRDCPNLAVRFYVVGGPIYHTPASQFSQQDLRALVERLGVNDRVGFVPFQRNTADVYRMLDVVVHASTRPEPFGMTIVEAMACGRPVIVSAGGGAAELFQAGTDAVGFSPGDIDGLVQRMAELGRNADLRCELGKRGRDAALARFSLPHFASELRRAYADLVPDLAAQDSGLHTDLPAVHTDRQQQIRRRKNVLSPLT
jgi:glycosyltransferase involved in cell wall biosynthesis